MRKPLIFLKTIFELDVKKLQAWGKTVLFIDADNTLFLPNVSLVQQDISRIKNKLQALKKAGLFIVIISNNFSQEKERFFADLAIPTIFSAKKPLPFGYRKAYQRAITTLKQPELNKRQIVHIGDQFMTDALGSVCYGIDYILVEPIDQASDLIFAKPSRFLEKLLKIYPSL